MLHGSKENSMLVKRIAAYIPIYLQPFLKYSPRDVPRGKENVVKNVYTFLVQCIDKICESYHDLMLILF